MIQTTCNWTGGVNVRAIVVAKRCRLEAVANSKSSASGAIKNRKRQSALIRDNSANSPATEQLIVEEAIPWYRNIVRIADHQPLRAIKVANRSAGQRQALIIKDVGASLAGARLVKLIRTLRATDIINGAGPGKRSLEVETAG